MKRFNKTAIALATAGALAFAVIPSADAQTGAVQADTDKPATLGDLTSTPAAPAQPEAPAPTPIPTGKNQGHFEGEADNADATKINQLTDEAKAKDLAAKAAQGNFNSKTVGPINCKIQAADGNVVTLTFTPDDQGKGWVKDGQQVTPDQARGIINEGNCYLVDEKSGQPAPERDLTPLWIALGVLGAVTLGGVLYNVVKDSQGKPVLVPADRPDQTPTAEDEKNTDKLVKENADEIAKQAAEKGVNGTEATVTDAAGERGVNADTGSNTIAKGLLGLVIASIMGAAVFMFGRRQLV